MQSAATMGWSISIRLVYSFMYQLHAHILQVEAYDPQTNAWTPVAQISQCRAGAGVAWCECRVDNLLKPPTMTHDSGCAPGVAHGVAYCVWSRISLYIHLTVFFYIDKQTLPRWYHFDMSITLSANNTVFYTSITVTNERLYVSITTVTIKDTDWLTVCDGGIINRFSSSH